MQAPARQSTEIGRTGRPSLSEPRRSSLGGRPSLSFSRRKSSQNAMSPDGRSSSAPVVPSLPIAEDETRDPQETPESNVSMPSSMGVVDSGPPPLDYSIRVRKWSIVFFWSLVLLDSIAMPIALYFGLFYGTSLSHNTVFSITTAALGGVSILEYFRRFWKLWKKGSTCRAIGARRAYVRQNWRLVTKQKKDVG